MVTWRLSATQAHAADIRTPRVKHVCHSDAIGGVSYEGLPGKPELRETALLAGLASVVPMERALIWNAR